MANKEPQFKFKDETDKEKAEAEFANLKNQAGWKRLEKYYDGKIKYFDELLRTGEIEDIPELKLIRAKRNMAEQFRNLPDILLGFIEKAEGLEPQLDPYDK